MLRLEEDRERRKRGQRRAGRHRRLGRCRQRCQRTRRLHLDVDRDDAAEALAVLAQRAVLDRAREVGNDQVARALALLLRLREERGLGVLVVTHDLGLAWNIADRTAVMYLGRVVEVADRETLYDNPQHPYTQGLINALPQMGEPGERLFQIPGSMPSLKNVPSGCPFHPRCNFATEQCKQAMPEYVRSGNVNVACYEVANLIEQEKRMQEAES